MSSFGVATGIVGLVVITVKLIDLLYGMSDSIPKSSRLLDAIRNLHVVLERVLSEYSMTIRSFPQLELNVATTILRDCIQEITSTCTEYDALLQRIKAQMGGLRQLKWRLSEGERGELDRRLEAGKSTLQIFMTLLRYVVTQTRPSRVITCDYRVVMLTVT